MKKIAILILLLLTLPLTSWATAQFPENLIYEGKTVGIYSNPLEKYFGADHPRPAEWKRYTCTALWRNYVATWEIKDGKLYLIKMIEGTCKSDAPEIPLSKIFPDKEPPIFADWFSGTLIVPQGKSLEYIHMGYQSIYEKELHIAIKNGVVQSTATVDNRKKK